MQNIISLLSINTVHNLLAKKKFLEHNAFAGWSLYFYYDDNFLVLILSVMKAEE